MWNLHKGRCERTIRVADFNESINSVALAGASRLVVGTDSAITMLTFSPADAGVSAEQSGSQPLIGLLSNYGQDLTLEQKWELAKHDRPALSLELAALNGQSRLFSQRLVATAKTPPLHPASTQSGDGMPCSFTATQPPMVISSFRPAVGANSMGIGSAHHRSMLSSSQSTRSSRRPYTGRAPLTRPATASGDLSLHSRPETPASPLAGGESFGTPMSSPAHTGPETSPLSRVSVSMHRPSTTAASTRTRVISVAAESARPTSRAGSRGIAAAARVSQPNRTELADDASLPMVRDVAASILPPSGHR
jgi:hypothetical protein